MSRKRAIADLLFWGQLLLGLVFLGSRIIRMQQTLEGVLISEFVLIGSFAAINLRLAINAYKVKQSRIAWQTVFIYGFWTTLLAVCVSSVLMTGEYSWSAEDTATIVIGALGVLVVIAVGWRAYRLPIQDPMVRGYLAMVLKAWPQLALAVKIGLDGGGGLPALALVLGHVSIFIRIAQLCLSIKEAGLDRNRRGSLISEVGNELSWIVVTIVWVFF